MSTTYHPVAHEKQHLLAEKQVPRYTSYPTAPHFHAAIGAETYAGWLAALPADASLSLYLHVPFCTAMCNYCGCHTKVVRRREPIDDYADTLLAEIALVAARVPGRRVVHIHWGGGTPSMLGADRLEEVAEVVARHFDVGSIIEHAIELDPRQVTGSLARALKRMGVTRASLGVQDLSAHVQQAIGRVQPFGVVDTAVALLREAGIGAINIDLMYGLPKQTGRDVERTIRLVELLKPHRLALFGYAHVPWFKTHQRLIHDEDLPGPQERLEQAEIARTTLGAIGYEAIGLDHFARADDDLTIAAETGRLKRNFQGYTTDEADALVGLGVSSIGRVPQGFIQNAPDMGAYRRAIAEGRFATVRGLALDAEDRLRGHIIERLMCDFGIDLDSACRVMGTAPRGFESELEALRPLAADGLVKLDGKQIVITEEGRPFARLAAAAFDAYLGKGAARHSVAV